jgi:hypothetical protein
VDSKADVDAVGKRKRGEKNLPLKKKGKLNLNPLL